MMTAVTGPSRVLISPPCMNVMNGKKVKHHFRSESFPYKHNDGTSTPSETTSRSATGKDESSESKDSRKKRAVLQKE